MSVITMRKQEIGISLLLDKVDKGNLINKAVVITELN